MNTTELVKKIKAKLRAKTLSNNSDMRELLLNIVEGTGNAGNTEDVDNKVSDMSINPTSETEYPNNLAVSSYVSGVLTPVEEELNLLNGEVI